VTPDRFRRIALSMPDAVEGQHHGHPDFRRGGRVFASLHPDGKQGMVRVSPLQQRELLAADQSGFTAANGAWGRAGCTMVELAAASIAAVRAAMMLAWQEAATARRVQRSRPRPQSSAVRRRPPRGGA
jgi:hypothetical protein